MTSHNKRMGKWLIVALLFSFQALAKPTPVYLTPNHPAPTGHFEYRDLVQSAARYDQYEWLWVKDRFGNQGWVLKSEVLVPLDFSKKALLKPNHSIYKKPSFSLMPLRQLNDESPVDVIERKGDWFQVRYQIGKDKLYGWVQESHLEPYTKDPGLFFSKANFSLRESANLNSQRKKIVYAGNRLEPIRLKGSWAYVASGKSTGYIPIRLLKSRMDSAMKVRTREGYFKPNPKLFGKRILEIFSQPQWAGTGNFSLDLKRKPDMSSENISTIKPWQDLFVQGYSVKRWGYSRVRRMGYVWWPSETIESNVELPDQLEDNTVHLAKKEILQQVKSPKIKGLRFATTQKGVYRSFDGVEWFRIPGFRKGQPLTISKSGSLFVGDRVTFDHGENFHEFIRWDKILSVLPRSKGSGHAPLQILKIEALDKDVNKIKLHLRSGNLSKLTVYTPDFGRSWTLL